MKTPLQFDRYDGNSSYYVNPLKPFDRLRIGAKITSKNLTDGNKTNAVNVSFSQVRRKDVVICKDKCSTGVETTGISLEMNSSFLNSDSLIAEWNVFKEQVDAALSRGILKGLKPAQNAEFFMFDADPSSV